ncbi:MAG: hypothetical protein QOD44_1567 [Solirubrobacteraceae bacterium]|nr:hypothetical protein [Solirubrobacteraceae bacterium]
MERQDERLSTRDLASGTATDTEPEGDATLADPADSPRAEDTGAVRADTAEGDALAATDDRQAAGAGEARFERDAGAGGADDGVFDRDAADDDRADRDAVTADAGARDPGAAATDTGARDRDAGATGGADEDAGQLLDESDEYQRRWEQIQGRFVDEPRGAVEDADALVATVMQRLAEGFAVERERLEAQWGRGEDISTEDLRVALMRYRSFFQRLLST